MLFNKFKIPVYIFFILLLMMGLMIAKDYGAHWDEFNSHDFGSRWYRYAVDVVAHGASLVPKEKEILHDIVHGPAIEMFFAFLADSLNFKDSRDIILLRHYALWLLFYISVLFFYCLCRLHFKNEIISLLGCFLLVLHPRIFANAFYDSVDMAFFSFYIITLYTLARYIKMRSLSLAAVHGLACAILIDIRLLGGVIALLTYFVLFWQFLEERHDKREVMHVARNALVFTLVLAVFVILFWPYLWRNPLSGMLEVLVKNSGSVYGDEVLYFGEYVKATQLPWHYIPVWIGITTPLLYSVFFIVGCPLLFWKLFNDVRKADSMAKNRFVVFASFFLPLFMVIGLRPALYDSWRHMFFVYPAFVLVALTGIEGCYEWINAQRRGWRGAAFKTVLTISIIAGLASAGLVIAAYHPYQTAYFNGLAGKDVKNKFELDYWGLSYRKGLEYIAKQDKDAKISVYDAIPLGPLGNNIRLLPMTDRKRIDQVWTPDEAKYLLTIYRWHKENYPYPNEFYAISVGNVKIMSVFKLKD